MNVELLNHPATTVEQIARGEVVTVQPDGRIVVSRDDVDFSELLCDLLHSAEGMTLQLAPGDRVLIWLPIQDMQQGVVLGRIGPATVGAAAIESGQASRSEPTHAEEVGDVPDELVIEAKQRLTFKCGDGSITLRKDGKVLIKGKDLVSKAQRINRIKGGAVSIN